MKITRRLSALFAVTLCLAVLTSASFAKNNPLIGPTGLAVDAASNLYVGNYSENNILIYNSSYAQQTSKTITQNIGLPSGVAIDLYGNLWVSNGFPASITEYTGGVQNTSATITKGVNDPLSLAFDGLDNLWLFNVGNVTIYNPTGAYLPPSNLERTISISGVNCFAVGAGAFLYGTNAETFVESASATLLGSPLSSLAYDDGSVAMAPDNKGNIYFVDTSGEVWVAQPNSTATFFATLPFVPGAGNTNGLVVDNVKERLYVANYEGSEILVYSNKPGATYGTIIHKICTTTTCP